MVQNTGCNLAVTTQKGWNCPGAHPFILRRIGIHQEMTSTGTMFGCKIPGYFELLSLVSDRNLQGFDKNRKAGMIISFREELLALCRFFSGKLQGCLNQVRFQAKVKIKEFFNNGFQCRQEAFSFGSKQDTCCSC